ncbi:hypothetical protein [Campylobacter sp. 19-13652]|uniref:hypothetical protein n=1 Tax=Campylobacter sp. 19-13652 TaxID=2840180 RepID=UPI001C76AB41|nr:hypothetical protein [Campylobacter sp. 19-13652]BCX79024.1 hypothetical protein LBC_04860 [Campylobacter sp. 19-13652]
MRGGVAQGFSIEEISIAFGSVYESASEVLAGLNEIKISQFCKTHGINGHYICASDEFASDLCLRAISGLSSASVAGAECLVVATHTPDFLAPATSNLVHRALGLDERVVCFDLQLFCSGFVKALFMANLLLDKFKSVLLCCVSTKSKSLDPDNLAQKASISDSASALIIRRKECEIKPSFSELSLSELACVETAPFGGYNKMVANDYVSLDNSSFFNEVFDKFPPFFKDFTGSLGAYFSDDTPCFFHLPSEFFASRLKGTLGLSDNQCVSLSLKKYANTDINNIPLNLALYVKNHASIKPKSTALLASYGTGISLNSLFCEIEFSKIKASILAEK